MMKSKAKYKTIDDMPTLDRSSKKILYTECSEAECDRLLYLAAVTLDYVPDGMYLGLRRRE